MRMPELLFFGIELLVELFRDHILDTNQPGIFGSGVVDQALANVLRLRSMRESSEYLPEEEGNKEDLGLPFRTWEQ